MTTAVVSGIHLLSAMPRDQYGHSNQSGFHCMQLPLLGAPLSTQPHLVGFCFLCHPNNVVPIRDISHGKGSFLCGVLHKHFIG